jgi:hypothetical protein
VAGPPPQIQQVRTQQLLLANARHLRAVCCALSIALVGVIEFGPPAPKQLEALPNKCAAQDFAICEVLV